MNLVCRRTFAGPFQELDLRDQDGVQPPTVFHLGRRQAGTPSATLGLGKIHEGALLDFQPPELLEQLFADHRPESVSSARAVHQSVAFVVSENQRVERLRADGVSANDELLRIGYGPQLHRGTAGGMMANDGNERVERRGADNTHEDHKW